MSAPWPHFLFFNFSCSFSLVSSFLDRATLGKVALEMLGDYFSVVPLPRGCGQAGGQKL